MSFRNDQCQRSETGPAEDWTVLHWGLLLILLLPLTTLDFSFENDWLGPNFGVNGQKEDASFVNAYLFGSRFWKVGPKADHPIIIK